MTISYTIPHNNRQNAGTVYLPWRRSLSKVINSNGVRKDRQGLLV